MNQIIPIDYKQRYQERLEKGQKFQDFVARCLMAEGLPVILYTSTECQRLGESANGIEIKFDDRLHETGNLYIEIAERKDPSSNWVASGIYRTDNTWLYVIGNYHKIFIFAKNVLRLVEHRFKQVSTSTSKGYLIPSDKAHKLAAKIIEVKGRG